MKNMKTMKIFWFSHKTFMLFMRFMVKDSARSKSHKCTPLFTMKNMKTVKTFWFSHKTLMPFMRFMVKDSAPRHARPPSRA